MYNGNAVRLKFSYQHAIFPYVLGYFFKSLISLYLPLGVSVTEVCRLVGEFHFYDFNCYYSIAIPQYHNQQYARFFFFFFVVLCLKVLSGNQVALESNC